MPGITFKSRIAILFSFILALSLVGTAIIFSLIYYSLNLFNLEKFMLRESSEIQERHLVLNTGEIFFQKDDQGKTLSAYLRDEGLSSLVVSKDGKSVASYGVYRSLLDQDPEKILINPSKLEEASRTGNSRFDIIKLFDNRTYLELISPLYLDDTLLGFLVLSADINLGNQMMAYSLLILALIIPISILFGWLVTKRFVEKSFLPLESILSHMRRVEIRNLSKKIQVTGNSSDELVRLSVSFNEMLERIDEGVKKQKEFISNASHELKTPLSQAILSLETVEADIQRNQKSKVLSTLAVTKSDLRGLGDLIHSLLTIANIKRVPILPTDTTKETQSIIKGLESQAAEKNKKIIFRMDTPKAKFLIQSEHWKLILTNLITNALKYGLPGGTILVRVGISGERGYLLVENSSEKNSRLDLTKILNRFYRGKDTKETGQGLGLSIVGDIVSHYRLDMKIDFDSKNIFRVYISGFDLDN